MNELRLKFAAYDTDNSGSIDRVECRKLIEESLGDGQKLTEEELNEALKEMDPNNSGAWLLARRLLGYYTIIVWLTGSRSLAARLLHRPGDVSWNEFKTWFFKDDE